MEVPSISYSCGYTSSNKEWKNRAIPYSIQQTTITNTATSATMTPQDVENYKAIVLSAVENNREGCITDIYLDIMSTNGDRLRHNTHFHYEYQANYHRAYQEVNGHPYPYGGTLTRNAKINYTLPPKKDGCCES